ncbi:MAG TPA: hypothetical protein VIF62_37035 [Labilithrix sp.]
MDRGEFAKKALAHLKQRFPKDDFELRESDFLIVAKKEGADAPALISLANYWDEWRHAAAGEEDRVWARIELQQRLVDGKETLDELRVLFVPRIRPRRYYTQDVQRFAESLPSPKKNPTPYHKPLAEHLGVGIAIDRPEHIEYVTDPEKYALPVEELEEIALTNLRRATKSTKLEEIAPGVLLGHWQDEYAAERMLLPEIWEGLAVKGDPVVFLPGAERIYVIGSEDEAALGVAMHLASERTSKPRGLVEYAFVRHAGEWKLFEPLARFLNRDLADAYEWQKEKLSAAYEGDDDAPFIASVKMFRKGDEPPFTVATWTSGVHTLLPRTDRLSFVDLDKDDVVMTTWAQAWPHVAALAKPVADVYPPRWEVTAFPDEATLAKLRRLMDAPVRPRMARAEVERRLARPEATTRRPPWGLIVTVVIAAVLIALRLLSR